MDAGEACDDGDANSDVDAGACRTDCSLAGCGDGILDPSEACDDGDANSDTVADACRTTCVEPSCGDGVIDSVEDCEGDLLGGATCVSEGYASGSLACSLCVFDEVACIADPAPSVGQVIITEVMANPGAVSDSLGEYFELYNTSASTTLELLGCTVTLAPDTVRTITSSLTIAPGEYLALARSDAPGFAPDYVYDTFIMPNDGGSLAIACGGTVIDEISFPSATAGEAYSLDPDLLDAEENDIAGSWCGAHLSMFDAGDDLGTPGAANGDCQYCGNSIINPGETCDGSDLGGTCTGLGYTGGVLACSDLCSHDTSGCSSEVPNVFFSEYIEGSSNNKFVEIHNGGAGSVDLALCEIRIFVNGADLVSGTVGHISLTGSLLSGASHVVCNSASGDTTLCDETSGAMTFNGDDTVVLHCSGTDVDTIGQVGVDPGSEWMANGVGTQNETIRRNCDITSGDRISDDAFDPSLQWTSYPIDTFNGLGNHCESIAPVPTAGELIITEVMHAAGADWIEVHNPSGADFDIGGCQLTSIHVTETFAMPQVVEAGAYLSIGAASAGFTPDVVIDGFALDTDLDIITLACAGTVDAVEYESAPTGAFPVLDGASLTLAPDHISATANDAASNWCLAVDTYDGSLRGTPGQANAICPTGTVSWSRLQFPHTMTIDAGATSGLVYGQFLIPGVTGDDGSGLTNQVVMQLGYGPFGENPVTHAGFTWITAEHHADFSEPGFEVNSEAQAALPGLAAGDYSYFYRFSNDGGVTWLYADTTGASNAAEFDFNDAGLLEVLAP